MHIAVLIVGYKNPGEIVDCLTHLGRSDYHDVDVVLCENGGPAASATLRAALSDAGLAGAATTVLAAPGNIGYAGALNLCMQHADTADAYWILNPDTKPEPGALSALVRKISGSPFGIVGGRLVDPDGTVQSDGGIFRPYLARSVSINKGRKRSDAVDVAEIEARMSYVSGASLLITKAAAAIVGPMRAEYFLYGEEVEWCLRASTRGVKLGFTPDAVVVHGQGGTTGSGNRKQDRPRLPIYLDERNKVNVVRDIYPNRLLVAAPMAFLFIFLRYLRPQTYRQLGFALAGWAAGIRNERGRPSWTP